MTAKPDQPPPPGPEVLQVPIFRIQIALGNDERRPAQIVFPQDMTEAERRFLIEYIASSKFDETVASLDSPGAALRRAGLSLPGSVT